MHFLEEALFTILCLMTPMVLVAQSQVTAFRPEDNSHAQAQSLSSNQPVLSRTDSRSHQSQVTWADNGLSDSDHSSHSTGDLFGIPWFSMDGGGGSESTSPAYRVTGTTGQFDAAEAIGESIRLVGGFWAGSQSPRFRAMIFVDGFESGDISAWD